MSISTKEELMELRRKVSEKEKEYERELEQQRKSVIKQLEAKKVQIYELIGEAERLARTVDLVFYYNTGYEEFSYCDEDTWNSSSAHC